MSCATVARPTTVTAMTHIVLRLTSGTAPIRGMRVEGKGSYFSVYDFMWNTGSYPSKGCLLKTFSRLISDGSDTQSEVKAYSLYLKFPGPGQRETPCMTIQGLQHLLCLLGGKIGQQYRDLATTTLTRVAAGDTTLIEEIEDNAASDAPVQQLAREALDAPPPCIETGAGSNEVQAFMDTARAMSLFTEERRDLIAVLKDSLPLIERDIELSRQKLEIDRARRELEKTRDEAEQEKASRSDAIKRKREEAEQEKAFRSDAIKRKREEASTHAIEEFLSWTPDRRKVMRPMLMGRLEELIPVKRARTLFITGLMKAPVAAPVPVPAPVAVPLPAPEPLPASIEADPPVPAAASIEADPPIAPAAPAFDSNIGVYVLKLTNGKYYVGQSRNIRSRIERHRAGMGSAVASDPLAVQIPCITPRPHPEDLEAWERTETLELMHQHGIDRVRGWIYNTYNLTPQLKAHANQQICSRKNLCHKCANPGHFSSQCTGQQAKAVFGESEPGVC